jgi:hypothetical protein
LLVVITGLAPALASRAETPVTPPAPWKFERIELKNGVVLNGFISEDTPQLIRFQNVRRKPGRPTVVFHTTIKRSEIATLERLPEEERKRLQERIEELEQSTPQAEKERMGGLELEVIPWGMDPKGGWRYASDYFVLTSNAPEEIVRRAAVRLEQIYTAYARFLPPRHAGGQPTSVSLIMDVAEYQKLLKTQKQPFLNPGFFDPQANRIVCASDLQRLGEEMANVKRRHLQIRAELDSLEKEYSKLYKGKELVRILQPIKDKRVQLNQADEFNNRLFNQSTQVLFATLFHEAFHAYLASFVYPPRAGEPARWLNEGLAQIFETALVEAGELRIGHADAMRLERAKSAMKKNELVPMADLLRSGPRQFMLVHIGDRQVSDRHYLTSWALASYLTFERRLLGSAALDRFVQSPAGSDPRAAFEEMVGQPLPQFEAEFRKYLQHLQPDGTVAGVGK